MFLQVSVLTKRHKTDLALNFFLPSVYILLCVAGVHSYEKDMKQSSHWKGFSPSCVLSCCLNLPLVVTHFPQYPRLKGFSPVCIRSCCLQMVAVVKYRSQYPHLKGFSTVCILSGFLQLPACLKHFSQYPHLKATLRVLCLMLLQVSILTIKKT